MNRIPAKLIATALVALGCSGAALADGLPSCDTFHFVGSTDQLPELGGAEGPLAGEMTITHLPSGDVQTAGVVTMLLGTVSPDLHVVTSHEIVADGEPGIGLVTFDEAQLIPQGPGQFTLVSHMKVKSGKGAYTCGEMVIGLPGPDEPQNASTLSYDQDGLAHAQYSGFGRLCRCKPADN